MLHAHWIKNAQGKLVQTWEADIVSKQVASSGKSANRTLRIVCGKCKEFVNS